MALLDWYAQNVIAPIERARAGARQSVMDASTRANEPAITALMGAPAVAETVMTGDDMLTQQLPGRAATGLMAEDLTDPRTMLGAAARFMSMPGMQQMGGQMFSDAMRYALESPQRAIKAQRDRTLYELDLRKRKRELEALDWQAENRRGPYTANEYANQLGSLDGDYRAHTAGLRDGINRANTILGRVAVGGITKMTIADDAGLVKAIIKLDAPDEAMNVDDFDQLVKAAGSDALLRAVLTRYGMGKALPPYQRAELLRRLEDQLVTANRDLDQRRTHWLQRADELRLEGFRLLPGLEARGQEKLAKEIKDNWNVERDFGDDEQPTIPDGMTEERAQEIRDQARRENPTFIDRMYNWYREFD